MSKKDSRSKFLSLILRHKPEEIGITLDRNGWADVAELIEKISIKDPSFDTGILIDIVETDKKGRYSFNDNRTKIRANQGHSIKVDVELQEIIPPKFLYHGTATRFLESIKESGLIGNGRLYVHLSDDMDTAVNVGKRHGKPTILIIDTQKMIKDGYKFYISDNGVYLTERVPYKYITLSSHVKMSYGITIVTNTKSR